MTERADRTRAVVAALAKTPTKGALATVWRRSAELRAELANDGPGYLLNDINDAYRNAAVRIYREGVKKWS